MLVKNWMKTDVPTIGYEESMAQAIKKMKTSGVQLLPVMKRGDLVGVVTDRDLKRASASDATSLEIHELLYILDSITVARIMTGSPYTVFPDNTLEEAALLMLHQRISGLPVTDREGVLLGTIMQTDLFRAFVSLTGIEKKGIQFAMEVKNQPGAIQDMETVIRNYGGRIISILSAQESLLAGNRKLYARVFGVDRNVLPELLADLGRKGKLMYMVDHRHETREIYTES